jgi:shikimate kinase
LSRMILTGFMGAGKSTVGALVAQAVAWDFVDLDQYIERAHGESVAEIFGNKGEAYFRAQESAALEHFRERRRLVLALGGGTIENSRVLSDILGWRETCLVFLDAPLEELLERVREGGSHTRPLLAKPEDLAARHARRLPFYRSAHLTISTSALNQTQVADQLLELVRKTWQIAESAAANGKVP